MDGLDVLAVLLCVLVFLTGMVVFSFLNVVIYRLPKKQDFVKGRSFCPSCGCQLRGYDMIPVLSWILLRGRCRNCGGRISFRYPLMEVAGGLLCLLCLYRFGRWNGFFYQISGEMLLAFCVISVLAVIFWIDFDTMEIPNGLTAVLIIPAILSLAVMDGPGLLSRVIGFFSVSLPMLLLTMAVDQACGGGDIKLMAVIGFFLGWKMCLTAFFLAILIGGVYGIAVLLLKRKGRKDHFAFGPCLCVGTVLAMIWGEQLLGWYLSLIL